MAYEMSVSDSVSVSSQSMAFSMEMDPDVQSQTRKYPSISDYYKASSSDHSRPIQLQHGLSNFSSLNLGDDRISFNESILSATYRIPVEDKMAIESPSKNKPRAARRREYQDATKKVGEFELNRLERVMKDKLFQRSYATSSPFQVRKAFKFFDREASLKIPIEGFTRALEFLGFQFSELQNKALFGRYDVNCEGEIDYMNFINTAMFYAAVEPDFGQHASSQTAGSPGKNEVSDAPDFDASELKLLQEAELRKMFNKVDRGNTLVFSYLRNITLYYVIESLLRVYSSGKLNKDDFELLLMALGHHLSMQELDACLNDMGQNPATCALTFPLFFEWWTDSMGVEAIRKRYQKSSKK
jgi:Ca2+-binding EF-hand superfamily protein